MVGNSTLDFNYYGPVEEYATYVKSRPSCYINADQPGAQLARVCMTILGTMPFNLVVLLHVHGRAVLSCMCGVALHVWRRSRPNMTEGTLCGNYLSTAGLQLLCALSSGKLAAQHALADVGLQVPRSLARRRQASRLRTSCSPTTAAAAARRMRST